MKGWYWCGWCVLALCSASREAVWAAKPADEITRFLTAKRAYVERVAKELDANLPAEVGQLFDTAAQGNWRSLSNRFEDLQKKYGPNVENSRLPPELWYVMQEAGGSFEVIGLWDAKYTRQFAEEVFKVVPTNAIYFGGTDPGRFIITAFSESHEQGRPFFTLTQNQLAARAYLEYARRLYGNHLKLPTTDDSTTVFHDYLRDAQQRLDHDRKFPNEPKRLKPGEDVKIVNNRVQVSGQTAVMEINARLVKEIFEDNPDREFYIEESFALDWMYPHLTPEGPIFKINRQKIDTLPAALVARDRAYWDARVKSAIGWRIADETSIAAVCTFVDNIFGRRQVADFKGDRAYLQEFDVQKTTGKLRSAIAGLYAWRAKEATSVTEKRRMLKEAELAFKQAYALGPANSELAYRFTNFLIGNDRREDARRFLRAAVKLAPNDEYTRGLARHLEE